MILNAKNKKSPSLSITRNYNVHQNGNAAGSEKFSSDLAPTHGGADAGGVLSVMAGKSRSMMRRADCRMREALSSVSAAG